MVGLVVLLGKRHAAFVCDKDVQKMRKERGTEVPSESDYFINRVNV